MRSLRDPLGTVLAQRASSVCQEPWACHLRYVLHGPRGVPVSPAGGGNDQPTPMVG